MEEVLSYSLSYGDELWHVVLYQWLIDNALTDRLLEVRFVFSYQPFVFNPSKNNLHLDCQNVSNQTTALFNITLTRTITPHELTLHHKLHGRWHIVVSVLESESSDLDLSPCWGHCVLFSSKAFHFHSAFRHPGVKLVCCELLRLPNLTLRILTCDRLTSHQGEVAIFLDTSCYQTQSYLALLCVTTFLMACYITELTFSPLFFIQALKCD